MKACFVFTMQFRLYFSCLQLLYLDYAWKLKRVAWNSWFSDGNLSKIEKKHLNKLTKAKFWETKHNLYLTSTNSWKFECPNNLFARQRFTPKYRLKGIKMFWQMLDFHISSYNNLWCRVPGLCPVPHVLYAHVYSQWRGGLAATWEDWARTRVSRGDTCAPAPRAHARAAPGAPDKNIRDASEWHRQVQPGHLPHHVHHLPPHVLDGVPQSGRGAGGGHRVP